MITGITRGGSCYLYNNRYNIITIDIAITATYALAVEGKGSSSFQLKSKMMSIVDGNRNKRGGPMKSFYISYAECLNRQLKKRITVR